MAYEEVIKEPELPDTHSQEVSQPWRAEKSDISQIWDPWEQWENLAYCELGEGDNRSEHEDPVWNDQEVGWERL